MYEEYLPFDDALAYEIEYSMGAKILAGVAVALLVVAVVGALVFLAAPVVGATVDVAVQMGAVAGAVTAVTGIVTTVCTAVRDNGEKTIGEYINNAFKSSVAVGGAMLVFLLMPYASEAMTAAVVPYGMTSVPIFGHVVSASLIEDIIGLSLFEAAGFNTVFKLNDVGMFFLGQKELGEKTGNKLYDDLNELSDLASWQIVYWAAMNPRLYENAMNNLNPKPAKSIAQIASYQGSKSAKDIINERVQGLDLKAHPTNYKQLTSAKMSELRNKIDNRTATREEYELYDWNRRITIRRSQGVKAFWDQERQRIINGEPLTRDWTEDQIRDIMNGITPTYNGKTMQGHHAYSTSQYPHLANKGEVIYPVTQNEHFKGWHGGCWSKSLPGEPIVDINEMD